MKSSSIFSKFSTQLLLQLIKFSRQLMSAQTISTDKTGQTEFTAYRHHLHAFSDFLKYFRFHIQYSKHTALCAPPTEHSN